MKKQNSNNFIASLFGSKRISRVVLMAYILAPIFLFAVGFASWTIVTPEIAGIFANGSFVSNQLLDSTKYISLHDNNVPFTATTTVGGFILGDGTVTNKVTLGVDFEVKLGQCKALFDDESEGSLYFTFALCFGDRTQNSTFFDASNFEFDVSVGGVEVSTTPTVVFKSSAESDGTGVKASIKSFKIDENSAFATEASTSSSYVFVLLLHFPADGTTIALDESISLSIDYTLTPQSAEDYRALMDIMFGGTGNSKSLMSDVRITGYTPYTME